MPNPTLDSLHTLLGEAAKRLDGAAQQVRDIPFEPTELHIRKIGEILVGIFEIQHEIYKLRPDLKPAFLLQRSAHAEANRALGRAVVEAASLAESGDIPGAIATFERFLRSDPPQHHRDIAESEIRRLKECP